MIYVNEHIDLLDIPDALTKVSRRRREHAMRYRQEHDRKLSLAVFLLLREGLAREYGITDMPEFIIGENGKPLLAGHRHIHFNMSHCREAAVCVISDAPVGVDAESIRPLDEDVLRRTMNDSECRHVMRSARPEEEFSRLWTMKESVLKLTGEGLTDDLHHLLDNALHQFRFNTEVRENFIITTCQFINNT